MVGTADLASAYLGAIRRLRSLLGEDWPAEQIMRGHRLLGVLMNVSRSQILWLIDFVWTLGDLNSRGFDDLVPRVKDRDQYADAAEEVMFAAKLSHAGIEVSKPRRTNYRTPDFKIQLNGSDAFVEVSNLREPASQRRANRTFDQIIFHCFRLQSKFPQVGFGGKIHKFLSRPHLELLKNQLNEAFQKAETVGTVEILEHGAFDLRVFDMRKPELSVGLQGPEFDPPRPSRIIEKIYHEAKQLPKEHPGFLVLVDQNMVLDSMVPGFFEYLGSQVCEGVYDNDRLAGLVITLSYIGSTDNNTLLESPEFTILRKPQYDNLTEESLLIPNRFGRYADVAKLFFKLMKSPVPVSTIRTEGHHTDRL